MCPQQQASPKGVRMSLVPAGSPPDRGGSSPKRPISPSLLRIQGGIASPDQYPQEGLDRGFPAPLGHWARVGIRTIDTGEQGAVSRG